jgi:hypothetical protein
MRVPTCRKKRCPRAWCSIASISAVADELRDVDRGVGQVVGRLRHAARRAARARRGRRPVEIHSPALPDRRERDAGARGRQARASIGAALPYRPPPRRDAVVPLHHGILIP